MAMFADDTKCHRAIKNLQDSEILQSDLNNITRWCHDWRMELNQSKCVVLHITRSQAPTTTQYTVLNSPVNQTNSHKDLGMFITNDLKWNKQVQEVSFKANKMLGFVKRSSYNIYNQAVRKMLYLTLVRNQLAYGSQVWAPQTVNNILSFEGIQRRATKFILSLPYQTDVSYKERLKILGILPITYWHEYLDLIYLFKCIVNNSDHNITVKDSVRETRSSNTSNGILLNVAKCRTVSYQSFYIRSAKVWNNLPFSIRDTTKSLASFKHALLLKYYNNLKEEIYDPDDPRTFKSVCVKCHACRPLTNLSKRLCC